jgi:hypothetical protein
MIEMVLIWGAMYDFFGKTRLFGHFFEKFELRFLGVQELTLWKWRYNGRTD